MRALRYVPLAVDIDPFNRTPEACEFGDAHDTRKRLPGLRLNSHANRLGLALRRSGGLTSLGLLGCLAVCAAVGGAEPSAAPTPKSLGKSPGEARSTPRKNPVPKSVRMKLPKGTKIMLPGLANVPTNPKQTLSGFQVTFPAYTGPGRLKNYRITLEAPGGKAIVFLDPGLEAPAAAALPRFRVDIPQGTTLRFASALVAVLPDHQVQVTAPKDLDFELPLQAVFKEAK